MEQKIDPKDVIIPQEVREKWQNIVDMLIKVLDIPCALIMKVEFPSFIVFNSGKCPENPFKPNQTFHLPCGVYCEKTMMTKEKVLVPNALKDPEWDKNPSIPAGLIAYMGFPLFYPDKTTFGTLCVLDKKENPHSPQHEAIMLQMKEIIEGHLNLLWQNRVLANLVRQQENTEKQLRDRIAVLEGRTKKPD